MIFKLYYWFMAAGVNALGILLGVYLEAYTNATATEIGFIYMMTPFIGIISRPIICSYADRKQAHQKYLIICLLLTSISYAPFVVIPFLGPEVYKNYTRSCKYLLLTFKVLGDVSFGGTMSIGDSLAINYAHRIGTDFSTYRVWATISWMVFGMITGQVNEIWFLPKYVPAFMILISGSLITMTLIWLWPHEYFRMVPVHESLRNGKASKENSEEKIGLKNEERKEGKFREISSAMTKSLMPKEVVWAHVKRKLLSLVTCSCLSYKDQESQQVGLQTVGSKQKEVAKGGANDNDDTIVGGKENALEGTGLEIPPKEIDKGTQIRILLLLLRRDPRILLYATMLIFAGAILLPVYYFYMSLSEICQTDDRCNFSQLAGMLQATTALSETILFIFIKRIISTIGRLNLVSLAFTLAACKHMFYATIWTSVHPYFALVSEMPQGAIFGTFLVLTVELAHQFANEVEYIIPELVEKGIVDADDEETCARMKMSLSATMQSLMACANDGLGRGTSALIYGLILDRYSYQTLWLVIAVGATVVLLTVQFVNAFDRCLGLDLGLDVQFEKKRKAGAAANDNSAPIKQASRDLNGSIDTISIHSSVSRLHQVV